MTTISIIGMGAFGRFIIPYLQPKFDVTVYDPYQNLTDLNDVTIADDLSQVAQSDYILLAIPVKAMRDICVELAPYLSSGQTVIELASVKVIPRDILKETLGHIKGLNLMGVHALFGPTSGKNGIDGFNVAICNIQGDRQDHIYNFLNALNLNITICTAAEHDEQMAYVQGLTHLLAKTFNAMDIPTITLPTKTYELLDQMWKTIRDDSDDLFDLIQSENPHTHHVREKFIRLAKEIDDRYD
jgi:prephenate dehydrogenase